MVLGRHPFSIPLSVVVGAPADIVWKVLTDIESYPRTLSGIAVAERAGHVKGDARNANEPSKEKGGNDDLLGSQWNFTRVSVVEGQRYSTKVTVTRVEGAEDGSSRSFTQSTDLILGATCSLKLIVEPVAVDDTGDSTATASLADVREPKGDESNSQGERSTVATVHSTTDTKSASPPSPKCCRVTAIMTMIPHQWCTRILGILCCPCLLQSRARTAMERDLEDLARACEETARERRPASEEGGGSVSDCLDLVVRSQRERRQTDDADAAGGGASGGISERGNGASAS